MRWFCTGHFAATWLVCSGLLFRFHAAADYSVAFVLFALIVWPLLLWLLPIKGYYYLKSATFDRLKARVSHGELKKAVVFTFGFYTSLLASTGIGLTAWAVGAMDGWFKQREGLFSMTHMLVWFPIAFAIWALAPAVVISRLGRDRPTVETTSP